MLETYSHSDKLTNINTKIKGTPYPQESNITLSFLFYFFVSFASPEEPLSKIKVYIPCIYFEIQVRFTLTVQVKWYRLSYTICYRIHLRVVFIYRPPSRQKIMERLKKKSVRKSTDRSYTPSFSGLQGHQPNSKHNK